MTNYHEFKYNLLKDQKIKKAYEKLGPEFKLVEMIIQKRLKQGMTQADLAKRIGIKQPIISRLESGSYNPSMKFLRKVATALNSKLNITLQ